MPAVLQICFLLAVVLVIAILLRRIIILWLLRRRCQVGHPNRRMLTWWRWLVRLSKANGTAIEEELICLAEKARFSQHSVTEEELQQMEKAVLQQISALKASAPLLKRMGYTLFSVLY